MKNQPAPFPVGSDRDGNNVKNVANNPRPLEISRGHREYHEENSAKRAEKPDYARDDD